MSVTRALQSPWGMLFVALVLGAATVWLRLSIVRTTYEINQTTRMIQTAEHELERLEVDLARLKSPRRLEALARSRFGLAAPEARQIVVLSRTP